MNNDTKNEGLLEESLTRFLIKWETQHLASKGIDKSDWNKFEERVLKNFPRLFNLYFHLYSGHNNFCSHLQDFVDIIARMWIERPSDLKDLDKIREKDPTWFQSNQMLAGVCYVDLFAGNLEGIQNKIPYFSELGLTYLHLMPLFLVPDGENDGGYAISSYREINPALGSVDQLVVLAGELRNEGISLVIDFIFNHTSDESEWATQALSGDREFQDYYRIFPNRQMPDAYEIYLREIFPDEKVDGKRSGSFTYRPEIMSWVWSTFHSYQWDLNYANPVVFNRMVEEMLYLANIGVEILRLDALAFIWKQLGTDCENLPEAHSLIQAFKATGSIAAPALLFKSEAIVHPDEVVKYISPVECSLSYNPLLMAILWNSLATREVHLLNQALQERFNIGPCCAWVNYVRSHDDIGWTFSDEDAQRLGINGYDHRRFLNNFYTGDFEGSFAHGLPFQENPKTGDNRISGTCASLAGLEKALQEETDVEVELAVRRILLIHGIILTVGGIPLIYLGDEVGVLNDYSYLLNPNKKWDSRWVHRTFADWGKIEKRHDPSTIEARIYQELQRLIKLRKENPAFFGNQIAVINTENDHVLGYMRKVKNQRVLVLANFSEQIRNVIVDQEQLSVSNSNVSDMLTGQIYELADIAIGPLGFLCFQI